MARRGKRLTRKLKKTARKTRRASRSRRGGVDPVSKEKHEAYLEAKRKYEDAQKELQRVNATGTTAQYNEANRALNKRYQEMWDAESVAFPKPKRYTPTVFDTRY
jgi:hypothetical protein